MKIRRFMIKVKIGAVASGGGSNFLAIINEKCEKYIEVIDKLMIQNCRNVQETGKITIAEREISQYNATMR